MPRPRNPAKEAHRAANEAYRARLRESGKPEASAVDISIAAAVAAVVSQMTLEQRDDPTVRRILSIAKKLLAQRYTRDTAVKKLRGRLLYRADIEELRELLTTQSDSKPSSPHYSLNETREIRDSRSDQGAEK